MSLTNGLTRLATMDRQLRTARNAALATLNPFLSRRLARRLSLLDYR